jgi:uncharacterized membrane protein
MCFLTSKPIYGLASKEELMMNNEKKIVGVFQTEQEAIKAIEDLKRHGYSSDDISVVAKNKAGLENVSEETGTNASEGLAAGAATGGVLGGVGGLLLGIGALAIPGIGPFLAAGPIVATLTGAAVGAGAGGLVGGLIGLGIPEDEASRYNEHVNNGDILVLVNSNADRNDDVYDTFRSNNSRNSDSYMSDIEASNSNRYR